MVRPEMQRASGTGRRELDTAISIRKPEVGIEAPPQARVERFGAVDVGYGYHDNLKLHIYFRNTRFNLLLGGAGTCLTHLILLSNDTLGGWRILSASRYFPFQAFIRFGGMITPLTLTVEYRLYRVCGNPGVRAGCPILPGVWEGSGSRPRISAFCSFLIFMHRKLKRCYGTHDFIL